MKKISVILFNMTVRILTISVALPMLWLIEPFWRIRIAALPEDHIGNLAPSPDAYARLIQVKGMPPRTTHIFLAWNPANKQLLKMWKRHLNVIENYVVRRASMVFLPILVNTRFHNNYRQYQDQGYANWAGKPVLRFTEEEEERGRKGLAEMGIGPDDWFVCFHSRDPAYMSGRDTAATVEAHYSIRDSSIKDYVSAMNWISEQGGFALRMGAVAEDTLDGLASKVIDYASHHRSDFMDIYLSAKCRFFMGSTAGLYAVPLIFGVPTATANVAPLVAQDIPGMPMLFIPKRMRKTGSDRLLSFPECRAMDWFELSQDNFPIYIRPHCYKERGLEWVDNTADDIVDLCQDMMDWVEDRDPPDRDVARYLQSEYRNFENHLYGPSIGPRFALKYRSAIIPDELFAPDKTPE